MAISQAQMRAQEKYDRNNTKQFHLKLNINTDADIIAKLELVADTEGKQGYIKRLIRQDIDREEYSMKYQVEYTDSMTGATSPIDTITAPEGYTAEDYIRDCRNNADREWVEMLDAGEVRLTKEDE